MAVVGYKMAEVKIVISIIVSGGGDNSPAVSVHVLEVRICRI